MKVCMIMIMDPNRLIGSNGTMPWHIPSELQYFKNTTLGKPVIMGRITFESIGKPLPGRDNIVVTSQSNFPTEGIAVAASLNAALTIAQESLTDTQQEVMIIGGAALCREAMPFTEKLYLTELKQTFEGDTWFDSYDANDWSEVSREERIADGYPLVIRVLERVQADSNLDAFAGDCM